MELVGPPPSQWSHSLLFQEVDAAYEWHVDWDRWQLLSDEARVIMVAYIDSRYRMRSYSDYVQAKELERAAKVKRR